MDIDAAVFSTRAAKLRALLAERQLLTLPGCFDPLSARLAEDAGFRAIYLGGFATGAHLVHTAPLLTLTDMVEAVTRVARISDLPLVVDAESGWGDDLQTHRTVRDLEHAGAAAFHIEDHAQPKRFSYYQQVIEVSGRAEFLEKLAVALEARRDPATLIIGRTNAYAARNASPNEAYERAEAMAERGIELIFVSGPTEPSDLEAVRRALPDIRLVTIAHGDHPVSIYRDLGYDVVMLPTAAIVVAFAAVRALWQSLAAAGNVTYTANDYRDLRRSLAQTLRLDEMAAFEARDRAADSASLLLDQHGPIGEHPRPEA